MKPKSFDSALHYVYEGLCENLRYSTDGFKSRSFLGDSPTLEDYTLENIFSQYSNELNKLNAKIVAIAGMAPYECVPVEVREQVYRYLTEAADTPKYRFAVNHKEDRYDLLLRISKYQKSLNNSIDYPEFLNGGKIDWGYTTPPKRIAYIVDIGWRVVTLLKGCHAYFAENYPDSDEYRLLQDNFAKPLKQIAEITRKQAELFGLDVIPVAEAGR